MPQTSPPRPSVRSFPDRAAPHLPSSLAEFPLMTATDTIPATRPSSGSTVGESRPRNVAFGLIVLAIYVGIGLVAFWPVLPGTSQRLFGPGSDSVLAMWFLAWIPHPSGS